MAGIEGFRKNVMEMIWLCVLFSGFVLLFLQDLSQMKKRRGASVFGLLGGLLTVAGLAFSCSWELRGLTRDRLVCLIGAALTALLEIYVVFIAVGKNGGKVVDTGLYGFCRHPGFWIFFLMTMFMEGCPGLSRTALIVSNLLNFFLIVLEDLIVFPRSIEGYTDYKKHVGFLAPQRAGKKHEISGEAKKEYEE